MKRLLHSGDGVLLDGAVVQHAVDILKFNVTRKTWLSGYRLTTLCRPAPPPAERLIAMFWEYRGCSFREILETDPGYCLLALRQDSPVGPLKELV